MHLAIKFNSGCNWNCNYCIQNHQHYDDSIFINWINNNFDYYAKITPKVHISFTGGEPGLWSEAIWKVLLLKIQKFNNITFLIMTNGLVFGIPIFSEIKKQENIRYRWHLTPSIREKTEIKVPNNYLTFSKNVQELVVIDKEDIDSIQEFINNNSWITKLNISISQISPTLRKESDQFSLDDYKRLLKIFYSNPKISDISKQMAEFGKAIINTDIDDIRKECSMQRNSVILNIVTNKIYGCCYAHERLDLNKSNYIKGVLHHPSLIFSRKECKDCWNLIFFYLEKNF